VLGVVGEQARVKFREALLAVRAVGGRREGAFFALLFDIQNSFAEVQRDSDELFDLSFVLRRDLHRAGRQINVVFCETRQGREAECRDFFPVHNQVLIAFVSCPNRQVLVEAFTVFDQGCEEGNFLTLISLHDRGKNLILRLLDDRHIAGRAVLGAELHIEQTQEKLFCLFELEKLQGYILDETNTYTKEQFEQLFVKKFEKLEGTDRK